MRLQRIFLEHFRNHSSTVVECSPTVNVFLGNNGEGKTNVLEAISFFCLSKSFFSASDAVVLKIGEERFCLTGKIFSDSGIEYDLQVVYQRQKNQKEIFVNNTKIEKASELIGRFPMVILTPDHAAITSGSPAERRRFVDFVISQANRIYLERLLEYRHVLKQRNRVLSTLHQKGSEKTSLLEPWNEQLARSGTYIMKNRNGFINDFQEQMVSAYTTISGSSEVPHIEYVPSFSWNESMSESGYREEMERRYTDEAAAGYTLTGPHRDEFRFRINEKNVNQYASQGQHKTFLIALKTAEFFYLKNYCNETPIVLLDDVLSELDAPRSKKLLDSAANTGQVFLTSTEERLIQHVSGAVHHSKKFYIQHGMLDRVEDEVRIN